MKNKVKIKNALVILFVLLVGGFLFQGCDGKKDTQKIDIEVNIPLSGPIANWSGQFPNGFKLGIEDASKKFNVDPEIFNVSFQDNSGDATQAISA